MKRTIKSLTGYAIGALDGEIGKVDEFYFDDASWIIRYMVVETGNWLSGRKVLISPESFLQPDWENKIFQVNLTREQVEHSPDINTDLPVTRQEEIRLNQHYPWKSYWEGGLWGGGMGTTGMVMPTPLFIDDAMLKEEDRINEAEHIEVTGDQHLRSTKKTTGYSIEATDGSIGDIEDFIVDDSSWKIDFIEVDTGNWLPGKKVLISPQWIQAIDWQMSSVTVKVSVASVKNSPEYHSDKPIGDEYFVSLHKHYNDHQSW